MARLAHNHRNTPEIAALGEHFHSGRLPAATVVRPSMGQGPRLIHSPGIEDTAQRIANWYQNQRGRVGVVIARNDTGHALQNALKSWLSPLQRVDFYTSEAKNEDSIALLDPGVTIVNKESVKGQEFDTVFLLELECFIPCATPAMQRAMYMLCTRARDHLFLVHGPAPLSHAAAAALPGTISTRP